MTITKEEKIKSSDSGIAVNLQSWAVGHSFAKWSCKNGVVKIVVKGGISGKLIYNHGRMVTF